jgi:hypothetical protein
MIFMGLFQNFKMVKRKWLYLILIIGILIVGGIAGKFVHRRFEERYGDRKGMSTYQIYYDLLYLENNDNTKIATEQAKSLLPQIEKLSTAGRATQTDLLKNIYEQLTPQQYYALLTASNKPDKNEGDGVWGRFKRELGNKLKHGRNKMNIRDEILRDIIVKMLKDISSK